MGKKAIIKIPVCDQCGAMLGEPEKHRVIHSFPPKINIRSFSIILPEEEKNGNGN